MFKRLPHISLFVALAASLAAVAPAMATDEVPAPPVSPGQVAPPPTGVPCTDTSRPTSKISTKSARAARTRVVRGTASDLGCGALGAGTVARVEISVQRQRGARCKYMTSRGRLGGARSCARPTWLTARGTSSWAFALPKRLPQGTYKIRARGLDSAGNVGAQKSMRVRLR
jgi:hypothetical protein